DNVMGGFVPLVTDDKCVRHLATGDNRRRRIRARQAEIDLSLGGNVEREFGGIARRVGGRRRDELSWCCSRRDAIGERHQTSAIRDLKVGAEQKLALSKSRQ